MTQVKVSKRTFEYFTFSDQDDVWHNNKLERAIRDLSKVPSNVPALHCSQTVIVDESCKKILGTSPLFPKSQIDFAEISKFAIQFLAFLHVVQYSYHKNSVNKYRVRGKI